VGLSVCHAGVAGAPGVGVPPHPALLGLVAALREPQVGAGSEVTGVDDFAVRKRRVYGTVLVDLATGKAVELLADREVATLEAWLAAKSGAKVICGTRAGNAGTAHRGCLPGPAGQPEDGSGSASPGQPPPKHEALQDVFAQKRRCRIERYGCPTWPFSDWLEPLTYDDYVANALIPPTRARPTSVPID
jgi:hypothetical protein